MRRLSPARRAASSSHQPQVVSAIEPLEDRRLLSISLVSSGASGVGNGPAGLAAGEGVSSQVSDDGRYVVFVSDATNLVANDGNGKSDVFVKDLQTGAITLVSATAAGASGNGDSGEATGPSDNGIAISGNGRFVAFVSEASDLVANDTNGGADLFVRNLDTGTTTLVTINSGGTASGTNAGGASEEDIWGRPVISDDGTWVAFSATHQDLVAEADNDGNIPDTFVRNLNTNTTIQLTKPVTAPAGGTNSFWQSMSGDGRYIAFATSDEIIDGLDQVQPQIYVYDTTLNTRTLVSTPDGTTPANGENREPKISDDGRHVAWLSSASNLVTGYVRNPNFLGSDYDIFYRNLDTNVTKAVSTKVGTTNESPDQGSEVPSISADGRFIAYYSEASNITSVTDTNDNEDVFFHDTVTGATTMISVDSSGVAGQFGATLLGEGDEDGPAMSEDGKFVVFGSASALTPNDTNPLGELYVRDTTANTTRRMFEGVLLPGGAQAFVSGFAPAIAADGSQIIFTGSGFGFPGIVTGAEGQQIFADDGEPVDPGPGPGPGGPVDLTGSILATLPTAAVTGAKTKAGAVVTVTNSGTGNFKGPVTIALFLSEQHDFSGTEFALPEITKNLNLKGGQTKTVKVKIASFPTVPDAEYHVLAKLDSTLTVTESNENNNELADENNHVLIAAAFVDLTVTAAGALSAAAGKKATLALNVTNGGNVDASGTTTVDLAIAGATNTTVTVPAKLPKLKPGLNKAVKVKFVVPESLAAGAYTVTATFNPTGAIPESTLANNAAGAVGLTVV